MPCSNKGPPASFPKISLCWLASLCVFHPFYKDGWMTCDFTSFPTVFQSYQDDVRMIMKGGVQWNSVYGWEDFTSSEDRTRSARSVGQRLTHWATGAPLLQRKNHINAVACFSQDVAHSNGVDSSRKEYALRGALRGANLYEVIPKDKTKKGK